MYVTLLHTDIITFIFEVSKFDCENTEFLIADFL